MHSFKKFIKHRKPPFIINDLVVSSFSTMSMANEGWKYMYLCHIRYADNYETAFILDISLVNMKRVIKNLTLNPCLSSLIRHTYNIYTHTYIIYIYIIYVCVCVCVCVCGVCVCVKKIEKESNPKVMNLL